MAIITKQARAQRRQRRVRAKIYGTAERPRLSVHVSLRKLSAQLIDDDRGRTLLSAQSSVPAGSKTEQAAVLGKILAERARAAGVRRIVFDRGARQYHGRVQALAEALRAGGLIF